MSQSFSSGKVTASISGSVTTSVPVLPSGATQIHKMAQASGAATTTIHTVTAGKVLRITASSLSGNNSGSVGSGSMFILHSGSDANNINDIYIAGKTNDGNAQVSNMVYNPPIEVAAGQTVQIKSVGAQNTGEAVIIGYEVAA